MSEIPSLPASAAADAPALSSATPSAVSSERRRASRHAPERIRIPARHVIFNVGDPADHLYSSSHAPVVIYRPTPDGRKTILDIVAPRHLFGFSSRSFHDCAAVSAAPTMLNAYELVGLMTEAASSKRAFEAAVEQIHRLSQVASLRLGATTVERLASFLLAQLPSEATAPHAIAMPLSRRDLADHLATTVETIARNMAAMRRAAVIGKERRAEVEILDIEALEALASGAVTLNEAYVRERVLRA